MRNSILYALSLGLPAAAGLGSVAIATPIAPTGYSYIVPPQGGNPYPDSGNELTDGIIPSRSWGTRTITNFAQAADWSGWQRVNPKIRFDFGKIVDIGSVRLTADDGNSAAGVYFPVGATFEAGGRTITRAIADPAGAGPAQELFSGLNLRGDSLTLTVDGGARNWTMLGEVEFDTTDFLFNGFEARLQSIVSGRIESPFGTRLTSISQNRINNSGLVTDPIDNSEYQFEQRGELVQIASTVEVLTEVDASIADARIEATLDAAHSLNAGGEATDQISAAFGRNRVRLATQNGLFGTLQSFTDANVGWSDYFVIEGDEGEGQLGINFAVEGALSGDNAGISFNVEAADAGGALIADTAPFVASSASHGSRGYFSDPYDITIPFTYNEVFQLSAVLDAFSYGNSSVEFLNTVKINQFVIPDGANLRSSAIESGQTNGESYNIVSRSQAFGVPLPGSGLLLLMGALLLGLRQRQRQRQRPVL